MRNMSYMYMIITNIVADLTAFGMCMCLCHGCSVSPPEMIPVAVILPEGALSTPMILVWSLLAYYRFNN